MPSMRVALALGAAVAAASSGCASQSQRGVAEAGIPLGKPPVAVERFCRARAQRRSFPVACPTRYPRARGGVVASSGQSMLGPSFYWASFNDQSGVADNGHVILGGQRFPFSLRGSAGEAWPRPGEARPVRQLQLPRAQTLLQSDGTSYVVREAPRVLSRTTVRGAPGLILAAPSYPAGGMHGDHLIVLWNRSGRGYFVSLHLEAAPGRRDYTRVERRAAAVATARSFELMPPGGASIG